MAYSRLKCPECDADFGQESRFVDHLADVHGINLEKQLQLYLTLHHSGVHPTCGCSADCQVKLPWAGWKKGFTSRFARGHNARIDSVYLDKERQATFCEKRAAGYASGRNQIWNKGLTKETDERLLKQGAATSITLREAYASGAIDDWRALNPDKAKEAAAKNSATKKKKYKEGSLVPWNKGLTKHTSQALLNSARAIALNHVTSPDASAKRLSPDDIVRRVREQEVFELVTDPRDYKNKYQLLDLRCKTCNEISQKNIMMLQSTPVCFKCNPKGSLAQLQVLEFVRSLGVEALSGDRSVIAPKELDVYVPSHRLGIEYNGLYWHSESVIKDKNYHQLKADACRAANIRLFSIYEDEWRDKRYLVEAMLRHRLGMDSERLDARKLRIVELFNRDAASFFDAHHLEGHVRSSVIYGLACPAGRIVAAMSLRTAFHKRYFEYYEVARSCTLPEISIRGWLGRLTNRCLQRAKIDGKKGLMTYVDGRVGLGSGYAAAGWKLVKGDTGPRFWWTDHVRRFNRFAVRADSSTGLTQVEAALAAGVVPIWGCSNSIWEMLA